MPTTQPVCVAMIGCGGFARHHLRRMLPLADRPTIPVVCEPSPAAYADFARLFEEAGLPSPPNQPDLNRLLADYAGQLDAAFIITPHAYHHDQVVACLEAGLDVLMEKPMTINVREALSLIEARDRTGRVLMVAFPASLSARYRAAIEMRRAGELGRLLGISATLWEGWGRANAGTWRHKPEISGGGYLFDAGAHMVNAVAELAGEDFVEAAALARQQRPAGGDARHGDVQDRLRRVRHDARHGRGQPHGRRRPPCLLQRGDHPCRRLGPAHGHSASRREDPAAARPSRCAERVGAIPGRTRRRDAESRPGRERAARGAPVGSRSRRRQRRAARRCACSRCKARHTWTHSAPRWLPASH